MKQVHDTVLIASDSFTLPIGNLIGFVFFFTDGGTDRASHASSCFFKDTNSRGSSAFQMADADALSIDALARCQVHTPLSDAESGRLRRFKSELPVYQFFMLLSATEVTQNVVLVFCFLGSRWNPCRQGMKKREERAIPLCFILSTS